MRGVADEFRRLRIWTRCATVVSHRASADLESLSRLPADTTSVRTIETTPTSSKTADCTPVVLRQTDRVRLVFRPTLVDNEKDPKACIRGEFVYQKKSAKDEWIPANSRSLATVKAGEEYKLDLGCGELLALLEELGPLYRAGWEERGVSIAARKSYVKLEDAAARFLRLGQADLEALLDAHPEESLQVLTKLVQWLSAGSMTTEAASALATMDPTRLPSVTALLGLSALKAAVDLWDANQGNSSEKFWQRELSRHSFVLSQLFAHPVVVIQERAYLGGKAIDDTGGSYLDFLAASSMTNAVALIEIKTPGTALLGSDYRTGAYPVSSEISGAIAQVLKYRRTLVAEFDRLSQAGRKLILGSPRCIIVAGHIEEEFRSSEQRESFEAFRGQLSDVQLISFDELFSKLRTSARLLEMAT
jgi:hypothetical protein